MTYIVDNASLDAGCTRRVRQLGRSMTGLFVFKYLLPSTSHSVPFVFTQGRPDNHGKSWPPSSPRSRPTMLQVRTPPRSRRKLQARKPWRATVPCPRLNRGHTRVHCLCMSLPQYRCTLLHAQYQRGAGIENPLIHSRARWKVSGNRQRRLPLRLCSQKFPHLPISPKLGETHITESPPMAVQLASL